MTQYIYRIQMKHGAWLVAVRPDYFMDAVRQAMAENGMIAEENWIARGGEIAMVQREEVAE